MTNGGITRHRVAFWGAVVSCIAAMLFAVEYSQGGLATYKVMALFSFMSAMIFLVGTWATRHDATPDPDED